MVVELGHAVDHRHLHQLLVGLVEILGVLVHIVDLAPQLADHVGYVVRDALYFIVLFGHVDRLKRPLGKTTAGGVQLVFPVLYEPEFVEAVFIRSYSPELVATFLILRPGPLNSAVWILLDPLGVTALAPRTRVKANNAIRGA